MENEEVNNSNSIEEVGLEKESNAVNLVETNELEIVEEDVQKNNNQLPQNEKSNKKLLIFLIVIIIALLGICGYFIWNKYLKNNDNEKSNNNVTPPSPSITPEIIPTTNPQFEALKNNIDVNSVELNTN